ncbi:unnamed protein product [Adineta steineri]|uniref:Uncharacterized protein n=1 Tax=Adineta steineri TaxID=433720 RepID=A0A818RVA3_9BILA|nr:unnamed protein product [Adineta steineri]CAF3930115.1 unnamed protein product [Adineta steineri]
MLVKSFNEIFSKQYSLDIIRQSVDESDVHIKELNELINQEINLLPETIDVFTEIQNQHREMIEYLEIPLQELCDYADGSEIEIDKTILHALHLIHEQLEKIIEKIENDFLTYLNPWQNAMLMSESLEEQIRCPIIFFVIVIVCCRNRCHRKHPLPKHRILYAVDIFAQSACRTVHDDQSFLISFLIDELLGPNKNELIVGGFDVETIFTTIINDCGNQIHFSEHFFSNQLNPLQTDVNQAMNELNKKIDDKFNASITAINITSDLERLDQFSMTINSTKIQNKIQEIRNDLQVIEIEFKKISSSIPIVPEIIINQTINDFETYVKIILKTTTDTCPLPLAILYKADTFICHQFATSINGLWFSLFIYLFFVIVGLCIFGLCIYKRL